MAGQAAQRFEVGVFLNPLAICIAFLDGLA
jgi:hypothetical protein